MGLIVYNGKSSKEYSILVEHPPGYEYPEKDLVITHVPGRNGDVIYDTGSYQNVDRKYDVAVAAEKDSYEVVANKLSEWLHSARTYARLEDSYEPEYYRMAIYKESNALDCIYRGGGRTTVLFNCKPQRFLKSGEVPVKFDERGYLFNPTGFASKPIIKFTATEPTSLYINGRTIQIKEACSDLVIDCDIQNCYSGTQYKNSIVKMEAFPTLKSGENEISFLSGISNLEITPNWWTL